MTDLYSYKGAYPYPLPEDMSSYALADFIPADPKPELARDEKLDWTGTAWLVRKANRAETAIEGQRIRDERAKLLTESDVQVVRAYEIQQPVPQNVVQYRQALRDITQQPGFPWEVVWPTL